MTTLIRYSDKNYFGTVYLSKQKIFRKFTDSKNCLSLIKSEYEGQLWYSKMLNSKSPFPKDFFFRNGQKYVDTLAIEGKKINFWSSLEKNYVYVENIIDHYAKIWPKKNHVPCHGDLTLENIIFFNNKSPRFIDWEHFNILGEEWGFDLAYLLVSTITMPSKAKELNMIPSKELYIFENLWKKFVSINNEKRLICKKPFTIFFKTFKKNKWKIIIKCNKKKLYPFILTNKIINQVHEVTSSTVQS